MFHKNTSTSPGRSLSSRDFLESRVDTTWVERVLLSGKPPAAGSYNDKYVSVAKANSPAGPPILSFA